jgi:hypothetical protein
MREVLQETGQVFGAVTAIGGSIFGLVSSQQNIAVQALLCLVIASAAGVIASTIAKRAVIRR